MKKINLTQFRRAYQPYQLNRFSCFFFFYQKKCRKLRLDFAASVSYVISGHKPVFFPSGNKKNSTKSNTSFV